MPIKLENVGIAVDDLEAGGRQQSDELLRRREPRLVLRPGDDEHRGAHPPQGVGAVETLERVEHGGEQRVVGARHDRQADGVDVLEGVGSVHDTDHEVTVLEVGDRRAAIREALQAVWAEGAAATVAVVGKGHETGQEVGGVVHHFDAREEVAEALRRADIDVPVHGYGIPKGFHDHGSRGHVLERIGLTPDPIVTDVLARLARA